MSAVIIRYTDATGVTTDIIVTIPVDDVIG